MKSSFLIVADRGNLKAYRVEKVPGDRPPRVHLLQAFSLADAHTKVSEMHTDMAGRFPKGGEPHGPNGSGLKHQNSTAERHYELEIGRRLVRQLAEMISSILQAEKPGFWSFAAPAEVNRAILEELPADLRQQLAENLSRDLVKVEPPDLLDHFTAVRAA